MTTLYDVVAKMLVDWSYLDRIDRPEPRRSGLNVAIDQAITEILAWGHPSLDLAAAHDGPGPV